MTFANKYTEQHYILSDDHRKQVVLSDTREPRKYIANNTKHQRVIVYKVDGGIISDKAQRKCDYAFWTEEDCVYFIELKGGDYSRAMTQLHSTIIQLVQESKIVAKEIHARIVLSKGRAVRAAGANANEAKLHKLLKKFGGNLIKSSQVLTENI